MVGFFNGYILGNGIYFNRIWNMESDIEITITFLTPRKEDFTGTTKFDLEDFDA